MSITQQRTVSPHEPLVRSLYDAVCSFAPREVLQAHFHPDAEQVEYPSLMRPAGHTRRLDGILAGAELAAGMVTDQRIDVHTVVDDGERLAAQLTWTATAAVDLGTLPAGTPLVAHVAAFYEFRDGLVLRQSSYDCYEPLPA